MRINANEQTSSSRYLALATANNPFNNFKIRRKKARWIGKTFLAILLIFAILLNYVSFVVPSTAQAAAPDPTIEQQINIIDQLYQNNSTTYNPTDNSLGIIRWDSAKYNGDTVYFEAVLEGNGFGPGVCSIAYAALFSNTGTQVTGSEVSKGGNGYARVRSGALTLGTLPNLESGIDYTVRVKCDDSTGNAKIKAARLIIVQTDPGSITDTQTQIEVGNNETTTGTSYADLTDKKIYRYTSGNFSPAPTVNFEASLKATAGTTNVPFTTAATTTGWEVPAGITSLTVRVWGGGGGSAAGGDNDVGGTGGGGGFVQDTISVSAGQLYTIIVGGPGNLGAKSSNAAYDGAGGGGGGYSAFTRESDSTVLLIGGGGGGGGSGSEAGDDGGDTQLKAE